MYAFVFNLVLDQIRPVIPSLWLLLSPIITWLLSLLIYHKRVKSLMAITILAVIMLSAKSDLTLLYFNICEIQFGHTRFTGIITSIFLILSGFILFKSYRKNMIGNQMILLAFLNVISFEVLTRIEYLSVLGYLNSL